MKNINNIAHSLVIFVVQGEDMGLQLLVLAPQEATYIALMHKRNILTSLGGGFNPFEKYARQIDVKLDHFPK